MSTKNPTQSYTIKCDSNSQVHVDEIGTITFIGPMQYGKTVVMEGHIGSKKILFWPPKHPRDWYWPSGKKGITFVLSDMVLLGRPANLVLRGELATGSYGRSPGFRPRQLLISEYRGSYPYGKSRPTPAGLPTDEHKELLKYTQREPQEVDIQAVFDSFLAGKKVCG